jgi:hypothetical protein
MKKYLENYLVELRLFCKLHLLPRRKIFCYAVKNATFAFPQLFKSIKNKALAAFDCNYLRGSDNAGAPHSIFFTFKCYHK